MNKDNCKEVIKINMVKKRKIIRKYANISNKKLYLLAESNPKYRTEARRRMQKSAKRYAKKSKGRRKACDGSNCLSVPAAAFLGLANGVSLAELILSNILFLMTTSPRTSTLPV